AIVRQPRHDRSADDDRPLLRDQRRPDRSPTVRLVALLVVVGCHSAPPSTMHAPAPSSSSPPTTKPAPVKPNWLERFGVGPEIPTTGVTFADPKQSSTHVEVTAKLIGVDATAGLCSLIHWGSLVEYEVVSVDSGTLVGQHFLAVVGCIDMPRPAYATGAGTLQRFHIGDTHKLLISTDRAESRGMSTPPPAMSPPFFYLISADPI